MPTRYLDLLSDHDLQLLAAASNILEPIGAVAAFKARPTLIVEALESPATYPNLTRTSTLPPTPLPSPAPGTPAAPLALDDPNTVCVEPSALLVFAAIVHNCCVSITTGSMRAERIGKRVFLPFVANHEFVNFASQSSNRLFLIELLGSYARSITNAGTTAPVGVPPVSSLDPILLARALRTVDQRERVGIYRRLGDLALFRSSVLGEDANHLLSFSDAHELTLSLPDNILRSIDPNIMADHLSNGSLDDACRELGPIWYRAAAALNPWESLTEPIRSVADNFDTARLVLRRLARTELLDDRQSNIFPNCALIP